MKTQFFGVLFNTTAASMSRSRHLNLAWRLNAGEADATQRITHAYRGFKPAAEFERR